MTTIPVARVCKALLYTSTPSQRQSYVLCRTERYRPPLPLLYQEPVLGSDLNDGMEWMFQDGGKALKRTIKELPPRDDMVLFNAKKNTAKLERNLCLDGCPKELKPEVISLVKEYWDVFCEVGLKNLI